MYSQQKPDLFFRFIYFFVMVAMMCSCNAGASAQANKFIGAWRGMTYGSTAYDPMFTINIKPDGEWTDLTFGEKHAINARYKYDEGKKALTLYSAKGSVLYVFKIQPATGTQKERMVEQLPDKEAYRAMVCYHYKKSEK